MTLMLLPKRNVILIHYLFLMLICSHKSVDMYISGSLICNCYDYKTSELQGWHLFISVEHASVYYLSSCSFSFEHAGPPSYLTVLEGKNSLKQKEVWLRPAESLAKRPGIVQVAPATLKQPSDVACGLLLWCLPACPCSEVSIGWAVDYVRPEDTKNQT